MGDLTTTTANPAGALSGTDRLIGAQGSADVYFPLSAIAAFITALISDSAPATLDTLNELAAALGDDPNFAASMTAALAAKVGKTGPQWISAAGSLTDPGYAFSVTSNAGVALAAVSEGGTPSVRAESYGVNTPAIRASHANGTQAAPTEVTTGDAVGDFSTYGWRDSAWAQLSRIRTTFTSASPGPTNRAVTIGISGTRDGSASLVTFLSLSYLSAGFSGTALPMADNAAAHTLGSATLRWSALYAVQLRPGAGAVIWTSGAGTPEAAVTAPVGSLYTRTDGGAGTTLYVKESGTGNTGWVAK